MLEMIIWAAAAVIVIASMRLLDRKPYPKPSKRFQAHPVDPGEVGRFWK